MAFEVTQNALNASQATDLTPNIVLKIEGMKYIFSTESTLTPIRYGDVDLEYGEGDVYGGSRRIADNLDYISFKLGTSTSIKQQLNPEKGTSDSISSIKIAMIDLNGELTKIFAPDDSQTPTFDVLGRRVKVYFGFASTNFPTDYITIFRGTIESLQQGAGLLALQINSPDSKKKGDIIAPSETELSSAMGTGDTVATVGDASTFLDPAFIGAQGVIDNMMTYGIQIDDEIMIYTGKGPTQFSGLTRGAQGTTIATHDIDANVSSLYVLGGNAIDIALKLMLSGKNGPYLEDLVVTSFVNVDISGSESNAIYMDSTNFLNDFGLVVGDYVSSSGALNAANNFSQKKVTGISSTDNGQFITIDGVSLVAESPTDAVISIRSQYDVLPIGADMAGDEVDIIAHNNIKRTFLPATTHYRFLLRKEIELKKFLGEQVYNPLGAYSIPRKAQSSVGYHLAGLIPGGEVRILDTDNVVSAQKINIVRSTSKNFFNAVLYKFDERTLEEDKFDKINGSQSTDSRNRINTGSRTLLIESKGLRSDLLGESLSNSAAANRLKKYEFGAEYIRSIQVDLKTGWTLEVGDIVSLDMTALQVADKNSGTRTGEPRLFAIDNKTFNLKTGQITLDLVDTNFNQDVRYALISPASHITLGVSQTEFIIGPSFNIDRFGTNEYLKWAAYIGTTLRIHNDDYSISGTSVFTSNSGNTIILQDPLGFVPTAGMTMEFFDYPSQTTEVQLVFSSMSNVVFADGKPIYQML